MPYHMRHGESDGRQIRIVLTALGIVMFFAVVSSGYRAIQMNNPQVLENCVSNGALESIKNSSDALGSEDAARISLENTIGERATFLHNALDVCDVSATGYVYKSQSNERYAVCGDGRIYKYYDLCAGRRWGGLADTISGVKASREISVK